MNLFPDKIRKIMLPCIIEKDQNEENVDLLKNVIINNQIAEGNEEIISGSTCCENKKIENFKIDNISSIIN